MGIEIVGREGELDRVAAWLEPGPTGPRALVIAGPPGIGKTAVWQRAVELATDRGHRVLVTRPAESEARLSYAALGDLVGGLLDGSDDVLPPPQRRALDVALLRAERGRGRADRRAVSLAVLGLLEHAAAEGSVVLAIDDVQWLDGPSSSALAFALRRLAEAPVSVLASLREARGVVDPLDLQRTLGPAASRVTLGPLPLESLARLLRSRVELSRPALQRVHAASEGNPLFALELVRALEQGGIEPEPGEPLPVPEDLGRLLRARVRSLPGPTRDLLLLAAAAGRPTLELLVRAAADQGGRRASIEALEPAEEAEVVRGHEDAVRFRHPLLASAVYRGASVARRRAAHRRLADATDDPEQRARHLALAAPAPDGAVAAVLEDAARHAYARGAPGAAAELGELARRMTPSDDEVAAHRRGLKGAEHAFVAGDASAARRIVEEVLATSPPGARRAEALYLLSEFSWTDVVRLRELLGGVEAEAPAGSALLASAQADLGWTEIQGGDLRRASELARRALALAERIGDPEPLSLALVTAAYAEFMLGRDVSALLSRAFEIEGEFDETPGVSYALASARNTLGAQLLWSGRLEEARAELEGYRRELIDRGRYLMLWEGLIYLSELETRAGDYRRALAYAEELIETLDEAGYREARETGLWVRCLAEAHLGLVDRARSDGTEGLALAERHDDRFHVITNRSALGFLELSLGDLEAAAGYLHPLPELLASRGIVEPGVYPFAPDAVEALVGLGRLDRAEEVLGPYERAGVDLDRPVVRATAARCRGLLAAARGELDDAIDHLASAVELHGEVAQPFELGRTRLVLGDVLRRAKRKRDARESLEAAAGIFDRLETPLWSAKARASLARISGRAAPRELSETERQVAALVAGGRTNREVADALFISVKTVEANLSRVYAKLGIRSRRELRGRHLEPTETG